MKEKYRVAAYPVFLTHSKKGTTWEKFLVDIGLNKRSIKTQKGNKASKEKLAKIYERAEAIRMMDKMRKG